jgi:hypothetical protein
MHEHGSVRHVDAPASVEKMPLDMARSPEDALNQAEETLKDIIRRVAVAQLRAEASH